ncbi:MAG: hypothetical protein IJP49_03255 [Bacteroidales bacterium]|jgi:hypothetical protein|nr:hypothetical protein [Bacteroidales bacterium]
MLQDVFKSGRLLLPDTPPEAPAPVEEVPLTGTLLVVASILLFLLILRSFLTVLPYLRDTVLRARGSAALENSVKVSRDRNLVAAVFLLPAVLLIYRYRLYDPSFLQGVGPDIRLLVIAGVFFGYLLLRYLLSRWARPRRRYDDYQMAYRAGYTFFILLMMLALATVGILYLAGVDDLIINRFLLIESGVIYLIYLLRRGQILSLSCNPLTTFLYLCGLELLPTALLVVSAVIL